MLPIPKRLVGKLPSRRELLARLPRYIIDRSSITETDMDKLCNAMPGDVIAMSELPRMITFGGQTPRRRHLISVSTPPIKNKRMTS